MTCIYFTEQRLHSKAVLQSNKVRTLGVAYFCINLEEKDMTYVRKKCLLDLVLGLDKILFFLNLICYYALSVDK